MVNFKRAIALTTIVAALHEAATQATIAAAMLQHIFLFGG
jgi:hypothetical protein